jgi:radical SAM protein with 4Fe4S-binding SPASM domain
MTPFLNHANLRTVHEEPTGQVRLVEVERRYFDAMQEEFGARFLEYRRQWATASRFEGVPDFPLSLDLEINASCNLRCIMCVMGDPGYINPLAGHPFMDTGLYQRLMDQAREYGLPAMTFGFLSEPLLSPDLPGMIRLARRSGVMDIRLGTNGTLLTGDISRQLIDAGLTRLEISLDALTPQTYARIRRGGNLDNVIRHVMEFLEIRTKSNTRFPVLRISFLKLPHNRHELGPFLDFWSDRADMFSIQEPIFFDHTPIMNDLDFEPPTINETYSCAQPWQRLIIRANGDAFPCCSIYGLKLALGSAEQRPLARLWASPLMDKLRKLHRQGRGRRMNVCRQCADRSALQPMRRPETEPGAIQP